MKSKLKFQKSGILWVIWISVLFTQNLSAQFKYTTSNEFIISINHFGTKQGLVHRAATALYSDSRGIIWVATRFGISRFDGYSFRNFSLPEIWDSPVSNISEDKDGCLWLTNTNRNNIILFHPKYSKWIKPKDVGLPINILNSPSSVEFIRSAEGDLLFFQNKQQVIYMYKGNKQWNSLNLPCPIVEHFLKFGPCFRDSNYTFYEVKSDKIVKNDLYKKWVNKGRGYIKTPFGVMFNIPAADTFYYENSHGEKEIVSNRNTKYIYGGKFTFDFLLEIERLGVDALKTEDFEYIKRSADMYVPQLRNHSLTNYIVKDDNIFITSNFGLFVINVKKALFRSYVKSFNEPINAGKLFATRGMVKQNNDLLVIQEETGLYRVNLQSNTSEKIYPLKQNIASNFSLTRLFNGNFLSYIGNEFVVFDSTIREIKKLPHDNASGFSALEVKPNLLLVGPHHNSKTLHWLDLNKYTFTEFDPGKFGRLNYVVVNHIAKNRENNIVFCTRNGIFFCDKNYHVVEEWNNKASAKIILPSQNINYFYHDKDGTYWLASGDKGMIHVFPKTGKYILFNMDNGFPNNTINIITPDKSDNLWVSTDNGLISFNKRNSHSMHFTESDGLSHNEFNRGSFCKDASGTMYFGSLNGITVFNPSILQSNSSAYHARLRVLGFSKLINNERDVTDFSEEFFKTNTATILPNDKYCILDVSILNYSEPEQVTYAYKIDKLEKYWTYRSQPAIRLGKIPFGEHKMLVKAMIPGYGWTETEVINLNVVRPFYLRSWFFALAGNFVALFLFFYIRWRTARLLRDRIILEREVEIKTRTIQDQSDALRNSLEQKEVLLKEIHHRVKNNLQVINSLLEMQNMRLENNAAKEALKDGQVRIMSIALIHQQLFQNENLSELSLQEFVSNLYHQIYLIYSEGKKQIAFTLEGDDKYIDMETAVPLGLILNEIFTNSFKYAFTRASNNYIKIRFSRMEDAFRIDYHDSGKGMPADFDYTKSKSLGLRLIHSLSKQINGKTEYLNTEGENLFRIQFNNEMQIITEDTPHVSDHIKQPIVQS